MTLTPCRRATGLDPATLRRALGAFPSGVVVVAAQVAGEPRGIVASSFTSVSLDPALVSFCVAEHSATWPVLRRAPRLGVSVLAAHQAAVCRQLAGPAAGRFAGVPVRRTDDGALLVHGAVGTFETSTHGELPAGDHSLVLLRLHDVGPQDPHGSPLVFHRSGFGHLAG